VPFSDRDSFLCLRLDGLVLDELSFGIDDENFIKTEGLLLVTNKDILVAFYCVGTPKIGATDGNTFRCSMLDNSSKIVNYEVLITLRDDVTVIYVNINYNCR